MAFDPWSALFNMTHKRVKIVKSKSYSHDTVDDMVVIERALEIRLSKPGLTPVQLAITMQTPGDELDLVRGFLYAEGIITDLKDISNIDIDDQVVTITLSSTCSYDLGNISRRLLMSSSCGICGKQDIDSTGYTSHLLPWSDRISLSAVTLSQMPQKMRLQQKQFEQSGGVHAAALFSAAGELLHIREDVGRHNALDKLVGSILEEQIHPEVILLSGRTSFEMVQKAAMIGVPILISIGPPTSLAVETAEAEGMTLVGFLGDSGFNIYTCDNRIVL